MEGTAVWPPTLRAWAGFRPDPEVEVAAGCTSSCEPIEMKLDSCLPVMPRFDGNVAPVLACFARSIRSVRSDTPGRAVPLIEESKADAGPAGAVSFAVAGPSE